jgi:hypothetical protein
MLKRIAAAAIVLVVTACAAPHRKPAAAPPPAPMEAILSALPDAGDYKIDTANSELRLLVYRAGPLARLGHNHVMVNRSLTGRVRIGDAIASTSFELSMPADKFIVDDTQSRSEEGDDFPGAIPEDAKEGTRRNMLGTAVLNAAQFPDITVSSIALSGSLQSATAELQVGTAGHRAVVSVPLSLRGDAQHVVATGSVEIRQTALGLEPYSLMGGALQVQDAMQLKFRITVLTKR